MHPHQVKRGCLSESCNCFMQLFVSQIVADYRGSPVHELHARGRFTPYRQYHIKPGPSCSLLLVLMRNVPKASRMKRFCRTQVLDTIVTVSKV